MFQVEKSAILREVFELPLQYKIKYKSIGIDKGLPPPSKRNS